jgi:alkylation response protein AidB-like acyl-CoA dehydrogenase
MSIKGKSYIMGETQGTTFMNEAETVATDLDAFAAEVREWIEEKFPRSLKGKQQLMMMIEGGPVLEQDFSRWKKAMGERGWGTPTWPKQYGGAGLSSVQARVLQQEMSRVGAWNPIGGMGVMMFGPTLLEYGNEEQKRRHIPGIATGDVRWCQGYSEPGAGSDLAALRTQCVDSGDNFLVNGQKIWTSGAQFADWCFCLVRTDNTKKHEGISFLLIDMKTPGVEVRPIKLISGNSPFCELFFTDVKVPKENLVGDRNRGWTIGKRLLQHERGGLSAGSPIRANERDIDRIAKDYIGTDPQGRIADPDLRACIAGHMMDARALRLTLLRAAAESKASQGPSAATSVMKNAASRIGQDRAELLLEIMGHQGLGWEAQGFSNDEVEATRVWLGGKATTIYGGSYEIQNNIIAKQILGLLDLESLGHRKMEPFVGERNTALLTEEQIMVRDSARSWLRENSPVGAFRKLRDGGNAHGFNRAAWAEMAELGWAGMLIPEQYGGTGLGHVTLGLLLEETGRTLTASPLISTALTATSALLLHASAAQKQAYLPKIAQGQLIATLAVDEGPHHRPERIALKAERSAAGYLLNGRKMFVLDGASADLIIVAARTSGAPDDKSGITLFLVDGNAAGLVRQQLSTVDSRGVANLIFENVRVGANAVLGGVDEGAVALAATLDRARAGLAAEMLGHAAQSFEITLDYLKNRVQFDRPIGTFQALQHRAAKMFTELELARSCVEGALQAIDRDAADVAQLASLAKAKAAALVHLVSNEMVQMHGGIGMTDAHDAGLYLKRARAQEVTFGAASYHRDRYATLLGY